MSSSVGRTRLFLACASVLSLSCPRWSAAQGFTVGVKLDFATGTNPRSVAIGDLNGDGKPDLVVANYVSTVSVLLGDGAGGFGAKTDFATGPGPISVAIGDLNGDGKPDLVVANTTSNTVSVLLGNGAGGFGAKTDFATGSVPYSVAIGDLNGDGKPDLAVANDSKTVSVLLGDGAGGFGARTDLATGGNPLSVAIGDLNGDGKLDLAVADFGSNTVLVLLGNGAGGFGAVSGFATGSGPYSVAIGDLNGDGKLDLAVANTFSNTVSVLLNTSGGVVPVLLSLVSAEARDGRVELDWFAADGTALSATSCRRTEHSDWLALGSVSADGTGHLRYVDRAVSPGTRYAYRLGYIEQGLERFTPETWVEVPGLKLALAGMQPNPAVGAMRVSFSLGSAAPAMLEILDVGGREVAHREVGSLGLGSHSVTLGEGGALRPGVYWVRLRQGNQSLLARGAVVR